MTRQYYGVEDLGLTAGQRQTLIDALKQIGANNPRPHERNHFKVRLDNRAVIFEGRFNDEDWTQESIKNRLAQLFGVDPSLIDTGVNQTQYGPVITFSRGGVDRLRLIAFGGLLATWEESHAAVMDYIKNNLADWEV